MPEDTPDPHITLNPRGAPCLDGTRHRVLDLVADHVAHGDRVAQIVEPSPDLTPAHVGKIVSRLLPEAWTCHTLRHRCATVAYHASHDLRAVQELLGHAKPETTAAYTLVPQDSVRALVVATSAA